MSHYDTLEKIYRIIQQIDIDPDTDPYAEAEGYWDALEAIRLAIPAEVARKFFAGKTPPLGEGYPYDIPMEFDS